MSSLIGNEISGILDFRTLHGKHFLAMTLAFPKKVFGPKDFDFILNGTPSGVDSQQGTTATCAIFNIDTAM